MILSALLEWFDYSTSIWERAGKSENALGNRKRFGGELGPGLLGAGIAVQVKAEQQRFVFRVFANHESFRNFAALNQAGQPDQLAQLAAQIEMIALPGDQKNITLALIQLGYKRLDIDVMQCERIVHQNPSSSHFLAQTASAAGKREIFLLFQYSRLKAFVNRRLVKKEKNLSGKGMQRNPHGFLTSRPNVVY